MADRRDLPYRLLATYGLAILAIGLAVVARELLAPLLGEALPRITFYPAIIISAYFGGLGPGLLAAIASTLIIDYFFTTPYGRISLFTDRLEGVESLIYLITAVIMALLARGFARARWLVGEEAAALRVSKQEREQLLCEQMDAKRRIEELATATERNLLQVEAIINSVDHGIIVADLHGNVQNMNPAALSLFGFRCLADARRNPREFAGAFELFDLEGRLLPIESWPLPRALRGESFSNYELRVRRLADGSEWIASYGGNPVRSRSGEPILVVLTVRDVTARRREEQELRLAKQAAEDASRAKDRFLATLSHELRTPLTPVLMSVSAMELEPGLAPDFREELGLIRRNVELQTRLIDDLLDLTRIANGKLELKVQPVAADALVRHAIQMCEADIRAKGIRLEADLARPERSLLADPLRIEQVIWNLLRNSIKFTSTGGRISVRCHEQADGCVVIEVMDSGIGIEPDVLPRIFDAFEQGNTAVTREFGGLGLGLAICKALVEKHGGSISAHSDGKGKGATFRIELPLAGVGAAAASGVPLHRDEPRPSEPILNAPIGRPGMRILLVEDHPDTARMLARLLRMEGYEVEIAMNVDSALRRAETGDFDLVISDVGLPDGSGLELMQQLQRKQPIKGICLSGYGTEDDIHRSKQAGFAEHLTKPLKYDQLQAAIARLAMLPV